ncbi:MAG: hypothetical protein L3K23_07160 [Thermoplasmata archaeon]|nr:hypothetical protein [Thermoplasmata archaeon]
MNEEVAPLPGAQGEADLARVVIEVEGRRVGTEERPSHVRDGRELSLAQPSAVRLGESEPDLGRHDGVLTGELANESTVTGEAGHRAAGGFPCEEGLPKDLVHEKLVVAEKSEEFAGEGGSEGDRERSTDGRHGQECTEPPQKPTFESER